MFEDVCGILQSPLQSSHDEGGNVATVSHGEGALQLQCADKHQQENFVIHQLSKLLQGFLHTGLSAPWHLEIIRHLCTNKGKCVALCEKMNDA